VLIVRRGFARLSGGGTVRASATFGELNFEPDGLSVGSLSRVSSAMLFGILLRRILSEYHLTADSKDVVKLFMGLIATIDFDSLIWPILD
jgi:hypothetical protein